MSELGLMKIRESNVTIQVNGHKAKVNWIHLFDQANSLYAGAFSYIDSYPYNEGSGIHLFKINSGTGEFTSLLNLLENEGPAYDIRNHMGI